MPIWGDKEVLKLTLAVRDLSCVGSVSPLGWESGAPAFELRCWNLKEEDTGYWKPGLRTATAEERSWVLEGSPPPVPPARVGLGPLCSPSPVGQRSPE